MSIFDGNVVVLAPLLQKPFKTLKTYKKKKIVIPNSFDLSRFSYIKRNINKYYNEDFKDSLYILKTTNAPEGDVKIVSGAENKLACQSSTYLAFLGALDQLNNEIKEPD